MTIRRDDTDTNAVEQLARKLYDVHPYPTWTTAPSGTITFVNRALLGYTGLSEGDFVGSTIDRVVHEHDRTHLLALTQAAAQHSGQDVRLLRHDGEYRWFRIERQPLLEREVHLGWVFAAADVQVARGDHTSEQHALLQSIIDNSSDCIKILDLEGQLLSMNAGGMQVMEIEDFAACRLAFWPSFWEGATRQQVEAALEAAREGKTRTFEGMARTFKGSLRWWEVTVSPLRAADGTVHRLLAISRDITQRKHNENLLTGQTALLEQIATGAPLPAVLNELVRFIEGHNENEGVLCSILRYDPQRQQLFNAASPNLPADYTRSINGLHAGPESGSCGTAAFLRVPVAVSDIATDRNWASLRDLALPHGLRACWSVPILSRNGEVFGTFAMYYREARLPTPAEEQLLSIATHLAQVAFERDALLNAERNARQERDESAALLDAFFNAAPVGFGFFDTQLRFKRLNTTLAAMNGYPVDEHLGKSIDELLPGVAKAATAPLQHVLDTGEVMSDVLIVGETPAAPGETRTWSERFFPVRDAAGNLLGVGAVAVDVTGEMQAHAALQRSEDRFRSLVAASVDIVWVTDPVGSVLERMPSWEKFCGVTHEVLSGFGWLDTLHPDDRPSTLEAWQRALSTRGRYEVEYRVLRHDGTYRLMHVRGVPVLDGHGNVREWIGNCTDITDRRRAEEQVTRLAQIVEASNDFIGIADLEGHAHFVNRSGRELLGLDEAEVPTTNVLDYFMPEDRATVRDVVLPVLFRQGRWQSDTRFRHFRTGEAIDVDWTLFLIRDPRTGDPTGIATVTRDIRERKRTEVALQEQTDILTTLNRINQTISAELDQSKLVQAVTDAGVELTGAQFGALFYNVKTENEESYTLYTLSGVPREAFASFPMPRNTQVFGPTFEGIGVVRVDDITKDPRYGHNPPYQGMPKGHLPVCSYLAAPVILRTGEVLGGLFFGHPEPGVFTERAEQLAVGLAAQTAVALDNARLYQQLQSSNALLEQRVQERTRQLEEQAASLDAFAAFTEAVGTETDAYAIARQAVALLRTRFPNASVGFYEPADNLWKLRVWSDNFSPQTLEVLQAGVPTETPIVTETLRTHQAVFVDAWDQEPEQIAHTEEYGAVGNYPLVVNGEVRGFLAIGQRYQQQWTERDKAMFSAVGRGFTLALERAEQTARIESQRDALEARARALEGFAQLTRNFALETDPFALVRHAQEILLSLLSNGYVLYWQPEEQLWRNRSQVGSLGNPALQEVIDAGLPYGQSPTIDTPWLTQQPFLEDVYTRGADTDPELVQHVNAVAMLPVLVNGIPHGIIGVGLFDQRHWTDTDRAVLETVAHSLGLALEGVESNRALQERTRELERSNAELERFAYVASHDLQEPLRTIASFTELINRRYGDLMDENGRKYLGFVTRGAERMKLLIDDLLVFSRLNTIREPHQPLSLEEPFQEAVQRLYSTIEASGAVITHDPFPTVMGDVSELTQLFQNLIGNAVKFRHPDRRPEVHVGVEREKDCWHVRVRDNGIGFEQKYADRIFQIFQRLHLREKYEGTGMGLAIVRKIVEHHSGRVWAESEPGKGSTFHFTVPVVDPEFPNPGETEPC